jgi:DNA processing protein
MEVDADSTASSTAADLDCDWSQVEPWLCLSLIPGVGPHARRALLERFGGPEQVLAAAPSQLRDIPGVGAKTAHAIASARQSIDVAAEMERCRQHHIRLIAEKDPQYPGPLSQIHDPPAVLYLRGRLLPQDALAVAIVGTRHATRYGIRQAERLAGSLARAGITIVSGLARGIDTAAHRAALAVGGRTVAVLASGLINIFPQENTELAEQIVQQGALVSECWTLGKPLRGAFPRRNRLISGLSAGVVVVEASQRSGALISARHALEQGRDVFAVPGPVDSRMSWGCHRLIRDGAKLVEVAEDVLEELGPLYQGVVDAAGHEVHHPAELQLNVQERAVLEAIDAEPVSIDDLVARCGLPVHRVLSTISVLEMRHLVRRTSPTTVSRR